MADVHTELPTRLADAVGVPAEHTLKKGEALFRNSDPVEAIFFVISGELKAVRHLPNGT